MPQPASSRCNSWTERDWKSVEPRHVKTNNVIVCPAKTRIRPGIRPVWSESSLSAWRKLGSLATHWAHSEDSDQTGWTPSLGAHSFCWFCHVAAQFMLCTLEVERICDGINHFVIKAWNLAQSWMDPLQNFSRTFPYPEQPQEGCHLCFFYEHELPVHLKNVSFWTNYATNKCTICVIHE